METSEGKNAPGKGQLKEVQLLFAPLAARQKGSTAKDFEGDCGVWTRASD